VVEAVCEREGVDVGAWTVELPTDATAGTGSGARLLDAQLVLSGMPGLAALSRVGPAAPFLQRVRNSLLFIDEACARQGAGWAVDSGKNPGRLRGLDLVCPELTVIHLVRDGRAIAESHRRREATSIAESARRIVAHDRRVRVAMSGIPARRRILVRFEDLCADPEGSLSRVCRFLDLAYSSTMLTPDPTHRHQLPGNEWLVAELGRPVTIQDPNEWRRRWTPSDEEAFSVAVPVQRRYGYADDRSRSARTGRRYYRGP
jgi:hypothetical protein